MRDTQVITRYPPSPTGLQHVGNIRTALFNFLYARRNSGKFIVRVEDTDKVRSKKEFEEDIFNSLNWLGLVFDGEVLKQSERTDIYIDKIQELIKKGAAYISQENEGENKEVVRFKNPGGKIKFKDLIRGEVEMEVGDLKDFIIARNINEPIYHLTVVVDDMESGVTHVVRGDDHISNTPRQILIQEALGGERPIYAHIPLILDVDRTKLSKRKHGEKVSLKHYREQGYLPSAIINFLALLGWNPGGEREIFSLDELIKIFDISKVQKGGAIFNIEKLDWINKEHLKLLPAEKINEEIFLRLKNDPIISKNEKINDREFVSKLYPIIFDHIYKWSDVDAMVRGGELQYFFEIPDYDTNLLFWKGKSSPEAKNNLEWIKNTISVAEDSSFNSPDEIKKLIFDYATEHGRGEVLWPLRVALSGKEKSPDPFTLLYVLGKLEAQRYIDNALNKLS